MNDTDRELVERARSGDGAAIAELFSRYWRAARAAAFGVTGELASAEDAAAEGFRQAWAGLGPDGMARIGRAIGRTTELPRCLAKPGRQVILLVRLAHEFQAAPHERVDKVSGSQDQAGAPVVRGVDARCRRGRGAFPLLGR